MEISIYLKNKCCFCLENSLNLEDYDFNSITQELRQIIKIPLQNQELLTKICKHCKNIVNLLQDFIDKCRKSYERLILLTNGLEGFVTEEHQKYFKTENSDLNETKVHLEYCSAGEELRISFSETDITNAKEYDDQKLKNISKKQAEKREIIKNKKKYKFIYKQEKIPCHICGILYVRKHMENHLNFHKGIKPYKCEYPGCDLAFTGKSVQKRHQRLVHSDFAPFECDVCSKKYKTKGNLNQHRTCHFESNETCELCGKLFQNKKSIKKHMLTHKGIRPYECTKCGKSFQNRYTWRVHQRVHTKEKPYNCSNCDQSFAYKCLLKSHLERYHVKESDKN